MLLDVLIRLSQDTGMHIVQKRASLVSFLDKAAKDIHSKLECNKIYRETTLAVQPDSVVSIPSYIGELRGMRMHTNELPFDLHSIGNPRYVTTTLGYKFKNWRDLGESAVQLLPAGTGPLTLQCNAVESTPVTIYVAGETQNATLVEEQVVMDDTQKVTTNLFTEQLKSISCAIFPRNNNITILDYQGNIVAILGNNQSRTRYKICDVSQIFWTLDTSDGQSLIDVLYKLPKTTLSKDSDVFYTGGDDFDEAWYNMAMYLYLKPLPNRANDAGTFLQAALAEITSAKESGENTIVKRVSWGRNKYFGLFKKYRYYPGSVTNVDHNVQG